MSGQPPYFIEPQLASRSATLKETIWLRIGALQTSMNDRDRALDAFERVLRVNPTNIHAMTQVGAVLAKKERYERAVGFLQRAIQAESTCGEAWAVLAHCYVMTDELPKAYQAYQNALNHLQDPSDPNLWYGIGLLYDRYGSLDNALEAFLAVLRIAPNFERAIEVCFCIGIIYKEQRKLDEAMQYFNKVSMAPNPPPPLTRADGWYQIGHVNELKRDISKALDMYKLALRENPNHAKTLQNLGWLEHSHKENSREAIHLLNKSLEADQNDGQTWYLLGRVYMASREFRQAYDAYQQAVYRDGRNATFWCSIGVLYYQMNQYRDAMDAYARAIRLNPSVSEVWYDLGTLYESCGQTNDAIDAYRRAADLAPESAQITERLTVLQNSLAQGGQPHAPQQSQPLGTQPPLQHPHPQLPPPTAHLSHQPPPPPPPGLTQPDQAMHSQPQTSQPPLPSAPTTAGHAQMVPNHQLQPILRSAPGVQQQPIPMLSQPQAQPPSSGHQPLPRHIMQHPLQQPPGAGSTSLPHVSHSMPNHLRPGSLPHLTVPSQPSQPGTSSALGLQVGATQRSEPDRALPPPPGQPGHLPGSGPPLPLTHPLPQLPSLQAQRDSTTPGGTGPQLRQQGKPEDGTSARDGPNNQPPLPHLRIVPKEGAPNQLEQIPSLQRPDGPGYGQTSRPDTVSVGGVPIPPIPSLAPLVNKLSGEDGPPGQQRLPPPGAVSDPNKASAPFAGMQGPDDSTTESHSAKPSQGTPKDTASQDSRAAPNGGPIRSTGETTCNGPTSVRKDAEMLVGSQNDEPKRTIPPTSAPGTGTSPSPSIPALGIRSQPPPRPNKDVDLRLSSLPNRDGDLRFGRLGASSLSKFGSAKPTPATNTKIPPPSLPSPLSAPTRKLASPLNGTGGTGNSLAPPLKSVPVSGGLGGEAIPSPNSLPALSGKAVDGANNSAEKIPSIKTHDDGDKKSNGVDGSGPGPEKPRPFGISRVMPSISSLNNSSHGEKERDSSSSKREASPSVDADKTYKRPRVGDSPRSEDREGDSRMTDVGNGDKDRGPIPPMNNARLPTVREYRERAQQRKSPVMAPLLRSKPDPQNAASVPYRVKEKKDEEKVGEAEKVDDGPS